VSAAHVLISREEAARTYVYFIEAIGARRIKIGFTKDVRRRLHDLSIGCPFPIELMALMPGSLEDEFTMHKRFGQLHAHGEWFRARPRLRKFIKTLVEQRLAWAPGPGTDQPIATPGASA
jgi:hypothetical protein